MVQEIYKPLSRLAIELQFHGLVFVVRAIFGVNSYTILEEKVFQPKVSYLQTEKKKILDLRCYITSYANRL